LNSKGITMIELVITVAIIMVLASVAVPAYSDILIGAKENADYASIVILNNATTAYAMLNGLELVEVFSGTSDDAQRIQKLVSEQYLMEEVEPAQDDASFEWDTINQKWIISSGEETSGGEESSTGGEGGNDEDTSDDGSGDGSGDGGGEDEEEYDYEIYGYGIKYGKGIKVWYAGEFYFSRKSTKNVPGSHKDWQKLTDDWFKYNTYEKGDIVTVGGVQYKAKKKSTGKDPLKKKSHWKLIG